MGKVSRLTPRETEALSALTRKRCSMPVCRFLAARLSISTQRAHMLVMQLWGKRAVCVSYEHEPGWPGRPRMVVWKRTKDDA